jgi:exosortase B
MDASVIPREELAGRDNQWVIWLPVLIGLAALYIPTYLDLAHSIWRSEEQAHGPIVLAVTLFLIWQKRQTLVAGEIAPRVVSGSLLLGFGLLLYAIGRSQDILIFEVGSQIPILGGTLLVARGWGAVRDMWFPLLFFVFMVPVPGILVDALTAPLKSNVSVIAEQLLYWFRYPIARSGVVLTIGQYQLLVADACSGLNSMFSLSALGLLYLYLKQHTSWTRNAILILSILPIAFVANIVRVIILVLVTYHLGDEAGQGFLHSLAGVVIFVAALLLLFGLDSLLGLILTRARPQV